MAILHYFQIIQTCSFRFFYFIFLHFNVFQILSSVFYFRLVLFVGQYFPQLEAILPNFQNPDDQARTFLASGDSTI